MIQCLHCGAETTNGLALCELCQRFVTTSLEYVPIYFRNLARWRPGRSGTSRPVPGSRVLYDGVERSTGSGDRISDRLDEASNALTTWARAFADDRPHFTRPLTLQDAALSGDLSDEVAEDQPLVVATLCKAFANRLPSIATLGWAGEFVRELARHEEVLRGLTDALIPGWYAGACRHCGASTYVVPGLQWNTCSGCGAYTSAADHLDVILDEARGWLARPKAIAEAIVTLVDTEDSPRRLQNRIWQWAHQGVLTPVHRTARGYAYDADLDRMVVVVENVGHPRYRLGDVLDLVQRNTRALDRSRVS